MRPSFALLAFIAALAGAGPASAVAPPRFGGEALHRLGPDARKLRFEGETNAKDWAVYVTAAQARTRARIHLAYSNAISVMPEVSTLAISVNDIAVAQTPIAAASDPGALDVELPRGLLTEGYNNVRISVAQRHRVDCSLEATYELWTQLDPAASGLTFPGLADPGIVSLDDLAAVSPDPTGALTIRVVLPEGANSAEVDRAMQAVESVAIRAGVQRPNVEIADAIDERPGLWLLVGLRADLRARGFGKFLSDSEDASPQLAGMEVPGRVIVVAAGRDEKETMESIDAILPARRLDAHAATLSAAHSLAADNGFPVHGGMRLPLRNFGVQTEEFNGRLFRVAFDIAMPADFYPADYDKLTLSLSAGYSAGLLPSSQILVRVNDREAGSMPLRNPHGDIFRDRPVSVLLSALRPGVNHIVIEAQTPTAEDAACDVRQLMDSKKRFVFFDQSELIMPSLARIARLPNLAATLTAGFPYDGTLPAQIFLPKRDRATIAAAATFLARTAAMTRVPLKASVTFDIDKAQAGSTLFIGALNDFPPALVWAMGVDYRALKEAWSRPNAGEYSGLENGPTAPVAKVELDTLHLYDQWADGARKGPASLSTQITIRALYDRYINVHRSDFATLREHDGRIETPEHATLLLAQAHGPAGGNQTWTMLVAANTAILGRDVRNLVAPSNWNSIEGRAASFSPRAGAENVSHPVDAYFIVTQTLTPANLRLVAAGFMSSNLDYYLVAVVFGSILLGTLTYLAVRAHGYRA